LKYNERNGEEQYFYALKDTLDNGIKKDNRTGISTLVNSAPVMIQHDMSLGFPLLRSKQVAFKSVRVELEGFIKGITDKKWYQDRGCHIWDEWCSPLRVPYGTDDETKKKMKEERDLGPIYGNQWRNFNNGAVDDSSIVNDGSEDQLKNIIKTLEENPNDRRMVCSAWNPLQLSEMALPPCHWGFMVQHIEGTLNLTWVQRSADAPLGVPFNLASYALLLHLLCCNSVFKPGVVTGLFNDFHIYENQIDGVKEQLSRDYEKYNYCHIFTDFDLKEGLDIFNWDHTMTKSEGYKNNHFPKISMEVAV
jgi:thymidylate synthase